MSTAATAKTQFIAYNDELAEEIWSTKTHFEVRDNNTLTKLGLMAEAKGDEDGFERQPGTAIQVHSEFGKQAGQDMTIRLIRKLKRGLRLDENGATTLITYTRGTSYPVGYEELPRGMYNKIWLSLIKHQIAQDSPDLLGQRTTLNLEGTWKRLLTDWLTDAEEEQCIDAHIDGQAYPAIADSLASTIANQNLYYVSGAATDETVDTTMKMSSRELRRIMRMCEAKHLQPIKIEGEEAFVVMMSSALISDLLNEDEFQRVVSQAHDRGSKNPLISGSIGHFYNLYIVSYPRVRLVSNTNVEQVMILGAGALLMGYGSMPKWFTRNEDGYGSRYGLQIGRIMGVARSQFYDTTTNGGATYLNQASGTWKCYRANEPWEA